MQTFRGPLFATVSLGVLLVGLLLLLELLTTSHYLRRRRAPAIESTEAIITQIQALSQLITARMTVDKIVRLSSPHLPLGKDRTTLLVQGIVKAGFDLGKMSLFDVRVRGRRISIELPLPRIIECELEEEHTEMWDHQNALFRPFEKSLEEQARKQAVEALKERARASRLKDEALERARLELNAFFKSHGFENVEVSTKG